VAVEKLPEGGALAVHLIRDDEPKALHRPLQSDGAAVEGPMVEDAQCESVADVVGSSLGVPPDVRRVQPDEIVGPAIFLASDAAAMVTGHVLAVDGGYLAQ